MLGLLLYIGRVFVGSLVVVMPKWFNTAGPCKPDIHYMLSATHRLPEIKQLIVQENYFVIHALRQVGKTTAMLSLAQELTASGHYNGVEGVG